MEAGDQVIGKRSATRVPLASLISLRLRDSIVCFEVQALKAAPPITRLPITRLPDYRLPCHLCVRYLKTVLLKALFRSGERRL